MFLNQVLDFFELVFVDKAIAKRGGSIKNVNNILYLHSSAECMIGVECARCLEKIEKEFRFTVEEQFSSSITR